MLLLVRFLLIVLASRFRKGIGFFDASVVRFTVLPNDCDLNFHLNAGRTISFMDISRVELLGRMRILLKMVRRGWRPVMGGIVVRFRRSILPFERFTVRSRLLGWDEKWFYIEHVVERGETFCGVSHARLLIRSRTGNVPIEEVLALAGATGPSPELPLFVRQWRDAEDAR